jgi:hypothetical protein
MDYVQLDGALKDTPKLLSGLGPDRMGAIATAVLVCAGTNKEISLIARAFRASWLSEFRAGDMVSVHGRLRVTERATELFLESIQEGLRQDRCRSDAPPAYVPLRAISNVKKQKRHWG